MEHSIWKIIWEFSQGDNKRGVVGTNSIYVLDTQDIPNIPKYLTVTYICISIDYKKQKADPNRVRITAGRNIINYPGKLETKTTNLTTSKILWNSILSTYGAQFMCIDINNFYLCAPMDRYEYM